MSYRVPENQTVSFSVYCQALAQKGLDTRKHANRIERAFDMGEPLWMIESELRMVDETEPTTVYPDLDKVCVRRVRIGK